MERKFPVVTPEMQKVPVIRRIPIPIYKKADASYTNRVQIGVPENMISTSADDGYDGLSDEENNTHHSKKSGSYK